jgi:Short-chain alcohol dehydrogenase of unknown specificity
MVLDFRGKTAVVTGGANGIGLAIARRLAESGASVWIFDLSRENPQEVASQFGARGAVVDVTERASIEAALDAAGTFDVLIANAGTVIPSEFLNTSASDWDRTLAVNLTGMFHTVQAAAHRMKDQRRGSIVLTASNELLRRGERFNRLQREQGGCAGIAAHNGQRTGPLRNSCERRLSGDDPHAFDGRAVPPGGSCERIFPGRAAGKRGQAVRGGERGGVSRIGCGLFHHWRNALCGWRPDVREVRHVVGESAEFKEGQWTLRK